MPDNENKIEPLAVRNFNTRLSQCDWWKKHKEVFVPFEKEETEIQRYNAHCADVNHVISLGCPFEGVIGNPLTADIIVVSHNPSTHVDLLTKTVLQILPQLSEDRPGSDELWEKDELQRKFIQDPEAYKDRPFPAYNLDPNFQGVLGPGPYGYWRPKLLSAQGIIGKAFEEMGYAQSEHETKIREWSAKHIAFIELFGYHLASFDTNPESVKKIGKRMA